MAADPRRPPPPPVELASPPCEAALADDVYMGFASRAELQALCAGLLAAEPPAGCRAAEWRQLLEQALQALGGAGPAAPAPAPAPAQPAAALRQALPRVRDDELHRLLCRVLRLYGPAA